MSEKPMTPEQEAEVTYEADRETAGEPTEDQQANQDQEQQALTPEQAAELQRQLEDAQQRVIRVQADFDNFRRRTRQEKEEFAKYASQAVLEKLLPVFDNFERALTSSKASSDFESLAKGVEMIFKQFSQVMEAEGLQPIQAVGEPFNPEFHQAIMQVESDEHEEGIVVEEVQKGYKLKDKVIRPAMVKVSM